MVYVYIFTIEVDLQLHQQQSIIISLTASSLLSGQYITYISSNRSHTSFVQHVRTCLISTTHPLDHIAYLKNAGMLDKFGAYIYSESYYYRYAPSCSNIQLLQAHPSSDCVCSRVGSEP